MISKAVFAGTFDPFTLGHFEIAERAAKRFDEVIVAVADVTGKTCMFSLEKRVELAKKSISSLKNVKVMPFGGFLVDFMKKNGATWTCRLGNATKTHCKGAHRRRIFTQKVANTTRVSILPRQRRTP